MEPTRDYNNSIFVHGQEIPLQEFEPTPDRRTLGEILEDEIRQWSHVHRCLKDYRFNTEKEARFFVGQCIVQMMKILGANWEHMESMSHKLTQEEFQNHLYALYRIRVSKHRKSQEDEYWQAGTYIYNDQELAAFISQPARVVSEIVLSVPFWLVRTNVTLHGGKGKLV